MDPMPERRRAVRYSLSTGTAFRPWGDDFAVTSNISTTGICLLLSRKVSPGQAIRGELVTSKAKLTVGLRVVHACVMRSGMHFVGAYFETPLTELQLRIFAKPLLKDASKRETAKSSNASTPLAS